MPIWSDIRNFVQACCNVIVLLRVEMQSGIEMTDNLSSLFDSRTCKDINTKIILILDIIIKKKYLIFTMFYLGEKRINSRRVDAQIFDFGGS